MLSKQQKEVASLYALHCIGIEDVTYLLGIPKESIPQEFYDYVKEYSEEYNAYLDKINKY